MAYESHTWVAGETIGADRLNAIEDELVKLDGEDGVTADNVVDSNTGETMQVWVGTEDEYNALSEHSDTVMYFIREDET